MKSRLPSLPTVQINLSDVRIAQERSVKECLVKLAKVKDRASLVVAGGVVDIEAATAGQFGPELEPIYDDWLAFADLARTVTDATGPLVEMDLGCPVSPRQVFAIGVNYRSHSGVMVPEIPGTFTKFPTCLAGPYDDIPLVGGSNDWEVELVAVIAHCAHHVDEVDAWSYVAGLAVGQDISDRHLQFAAADQWSLGKSRSGYGPVGPWVVTPDEISKPDDLAIGCSLDGETMQQARTSQLIFSVPRLIAELSAVTRLLPGDIIFTGTPSGVGFVRQPPRYLQPGQTLESWIEGIGTLRNRCR